MENKTLTADEVIKHIGDWWGNNIVKDGPDDTAPVIAQLNGFLSEGCGFGIYKNEDMGHPAVGEIRIMKFGEGCTYTSAEEMTERLPDTQYGIGWRYVLRGVYEGEQLH